ncbi:MAG: TolC family protein [Desulfatibacillaceae bacterium]
MKVSAKTTLVAAVTVAAVMLLSGESGAVRAGETGAPAALEGLDELDLATAREVAVSNNPSLSAARRSVEAARARVGQALSRYWPRIDASLTMSRVDQSDVDYAQNAAMSSFFNPGSRPDDPETYYTAGLQATWLLFDGLAREFNMAAARHGVDSGEQARKDAQRQLLSAVADAFHNARLARENVGIAQADAAFYSRLADDARARRRIGTGSLSDVLNFEVQVNSARAQVLQAEDGYRAARHGLAALMGLAGSTLPPGLDIAALGPSSEDRLDVPDADPLVEFARRHRPDVLGQMAAVRAAESSYKAARSGFLPTLNLSASYEGQRSDDLDFRSDDFGSTVAVTLSYNVFAGGLTLSRMREAEVERNRSGDQLENVALTAAREVRVAHSALRRAREEVLLQRENARLVERNRDLVEKEYNAGQATLVRLNEAQRNLTAARGRLASARVSLGRAWHNLMTASGKVLTP